MANNGVFSSGWKEYDDELLDMYANSQIKSIRGLSKLFIEEKGYEKAKLGSLSAYFNRLVNDTFADKEIVKQNVQLANEKQRAQDNNRIKNKAYREHARVVNALEDVGKEIAKQYRVYASNLKKLNIKPLKRSNKLNGVGVMQTTDLHGNELIDLPNNKYDFEVLSKRLKLYTDECIREFDHQKVGKVAMFYTGDLLNSDRRLDELINSATNRAKACALMQHLIVQQILQVRDAGYKITIVSVMGNESRAGKEMPFSKEGLSDNYDFLIMSGVKKIFEFSKIKGVTFGSIDQVEEVIEVDGQNWLISHDIQKSTSQQAKTQSTIGRYSLQGITIVFQIGGHIHATRVTDISARSGSMAGSNSFNENALGLAGKASHNMYVAQNGRIRTIVLDLQNVDDVEGYEIVKELEAYNTKSVGKTHRQETIMRIVI